MNEERRKQQILHILAAGIRKVMEEAHLDYGNCLLYTSDAADE